MTTEFEPRLTPEMKRAIQAQGESLVPSAEHLLGKVELLKMPKGKLSAALKSLLQSIRNDFMNPAVAVNHLRGSIGDDEARMYWRRPCQSGETNLGELLIFELTDDGGAIESAMTNITDGAEKNDPLRRLIRMRLIKDFLLFTYRHLEFVESRRPD